MAALRLLHDGTTIPVSDDPEQERAAVAAHPAYRASVARSRAAPEGGVALEDYAARHGIDLDASRKRPTGRRPSAAGGKLHVRLPIHLHQELVQQAADDGVSLNTLIVALLERGVGAVKGLGAPVRE
jgi:predicted HicB family RNase H-like nuclease